MRLAARIYQAKREKVIRVLFTKLFTMLKSHPVSTVLRVDSPIQELRMSSIHVYRTAVEFSEGLIHKVSYSPRRLAVPESGTLAVQFNLLCLRHPGRPRPSNFEPCWRPAGGIRCPTSVHTKLMAAILWLILLTVISLNIYHMWRTGQISGVVPQSRRERLRLCWVVVGAVNFVAFVAHVIRDGTCSLFGRERLVDGHYLVVSHGKDISFTPGGYWFSYWHGVVFVTVHLVCMLAVWGLRRSGDLADESTPT